MDALVCEGAGDALVESLQWDANHAQFLLRALLFRAITDLLPTRSQAPLPAPTSQRWNSRFASRRHDVALDRVLASGSAIG